MSEIFRLRRTIQIQGIACTLFFLACTLGSAALLLIGDPEKHGFDSWRSVVLLAGMSISIWGTMLLGSVYVLAAYYVEHFAVTDGTLLIRSVFQNRQFHSSDVEKLSWKAAPQGGRLVFKVTGRKTTLHLVGYTRDDRLRIIRSLRDAIPAEMQEGWPAFCHEIALPMRDGISKFETTMSANSKDAARRFFLHTRSGFDKQAIVVFILSLVLAAVIWRLAGFWQSFALSLALAIWWVLERYQIPVQGRRELRLSAALLAMGPLPLVSLTCLVAGISLMPLLPKLGIHGNLAFSIVIVVMSLSLVLCVYGSFQQDKQKKRDDIKGRALAVEAWDKGEAQS